MSVFFLEASSRHYADCIAIETPHECITYQKLNERVQQAALSLTAQGIKQGSRVALLSHASSEFIVVILALFRLGTIAAPMNTRLSAQEWQAQLTTLTPHAIWLSDEFKTAFISDGSIHVIEEIHCSSAQFGASLPEYPGEDTPATIIFTSGSSGEAKAIMHHLSAHMYSAKGSSENITLKPGEGWLLSLPLFHVGGLSIIFRTLLSGARMVLPDTNLPYHEQLLQANFTHLSMVSTQLYRAFNNPLVCKKLQQLKAILLGGSAIPKALISDSLKHRLPVFTSYGSTEMGSQITTTHQPTPSELETAGHILPYRELKISEEGEICVKGKTLFQGIFRNGNFEKMADAEGWYHTHDLGRLDAENRLIVLGRKDNQFISGGENIQPEEIEEALKNCPSVVEALVVPMPHDEFGERPLAFISLEENAIIDEKQLKEDLRQKIAGYKIPDRILPMPESLFGKGIKPDRKKAKALAQTLNISKT